MKSFTIYIKILSGTVQVIKSTLLRFTASLLSEATLRIHFRCGALLDFLTSIVSHDFEEILECLTLLEIEVFLIWPITFTDIELIQNGMKKFVCFCNLFVILLYLMHRYSVMDEIIQLLNSRIHQGINWRFQPNHRTNKWYLMHFKSDIFLRTVNTAVNEFGLLMQYIILICVKLDKIFNHYTICSETTCWIEEFRYLHHLLKWHAAGFQS